MTLPPLSNLLALRARDPRRVETLEDALRGSGLFHEVVRAPGSWVLGLAPLPGPIVPAAETAPTFFIEGGHLFRRGDGMTELVDTARRDPEKLDRFPGDFGFVSFLEDGGTVVVRSCGGRVPLYVCEADDLVAIGTRLSHVVRFAPLPLELDPLGVAVWPGNVGIFPDGRTFFRGVGAVPRGEAWHVAPFGRTTRHRYWDPRPSTLPRPSAETAREHVTRLRSLLLAHLEEELDPAGGNLLTLSGGADSSSLAALAAGTLGRPVSTLSLVPAGEPALEHARSYLKVLRDAFAFDRAWEFPLSPAHRIEYVAEAPTVAFPVFHPALALLPRVVKEQPVRVLFGGEFADQVCGSIFNVPDWARHTGAWRFATRPWELPAGRASIKMWLEERRLRWKGSIPFPWPEDLPPWVRPAVRGEYRDWRDRWRETASRDPRPQRYLALNTEADGFVAMNWEVASELGIRRAWPFFHREILELAFECHPSELVGPGVKKLIRAALKDDVPPLNLYRPKQPWPSPAEELPAPPTEVLLEDVLEHPGDREPDPVEGFWRWSLATFVTTARRVKTASSLS